jgi:hypothetical protein
MNNDNTIVNNKEFFFKRPRLVKVNCNGWTYKVDKRCGKSGLSYVILEANMQVRQMVSCDCNEPLVATDDVRICVEILGIEDDPRDSTYVLVNVLVIYE